MDETRAIRGDLLSCFDGRLPAAFERRVVTVPAGTSLRYDPPDWHDAIVTVEQGDVVLDANCGAQGAFTVGDMFWLDGLDLAAIRNSGTRTAVLIAVRRRRHVGN